MSGNTQESNDIDDPAIEITDQAEETPDAVSNHSGMDSEARRKLEMALEERRLQKEIRDYDFDLD